MADPHRRYDARQDAFNTRGRPSRSPQRWGSSSPVRYRRSPSPNAAGRYAARSQSSSRWRSPPRYRNRSSSPPPRGEMSPRRTRSRSPQPTYTVEIPESRRRRLLAEKMMSLETYRRVLLDSKSPWTKPSGSGVTPIPVPLTPNENAADYQQKFEFWLAQRNVTLASLRDDVKRERTYRCGYAQWRVRKTFGQTPPANMKPASALGRQRSRSRSPPAWARKRDEQDRDQYSASRPRSPERKATYRRESRSYSTPVSPASTPSSSRFYDVRRRRYDGDKTRDTEVCSKNCDRKWAELNRRLNQLERIVSRLDLPCESIGTPYEIYGEVEPSRGDSTPTFIDLTDDIDVEVDTRSAPTQSESKEENESADNPTETETRSVEITPTDSDTNHDGMSTGGDMDELTTQPEGDLKSRELTLLINAYNQVNDQVLMNQRKEKKMVADMTLIEEENTSSVELQSQIHELRDSIENEKDKRDSAVSAIIVHTRAEKQHELEHELQNVAASRAASEQDELHEKCAGIAAKLAEKDKDLARLQKQLQSLSSLPVSTEESNCAQGRREARELSSQILLERASKVSLETERQKIFMRVVKSSHHVHVLVSGELARKM